MHIKKCQKEKFVQNAMNINIYMNMIKIKQSQWVLNLHVNNVINQNKDYIIKITKKNINSVIKIL